jgi:hypothetical protein
MWAQNNNNSTVVVFIGSRLGSFENSQAKTVMIAMMRLYWSPDAVPKASRSGLIKAIHPQTRMPICGFTTAISMAMVTRVSKSRLRKEDSGYLLFVTFELIEGNF